MYNVQICSLLVSLLGVASIAQELGDITIYNSSNSGLNYNDIKCLEFDDLNNLWIGTENGLNIFNESSNSWINVDSNLLQSYTATALEWNQYNEPANMLIGTPNGIKSVSWAGEFSTNISEWDWIHNVGDKCAPNNGLINSILINYNTSKLWSGSTDGLCVENLGDEGSWLIQNTENGFYSSNITNIVQNNSTGLIGIGTINGGLITYEEEFNIYYTSNSNILDNSVFDVVFDQNNNIIICTPQAGLGVLTANGSWIWFNTINSNLPTNSLQNIAVDNNNNLWITTLENGLIHYINNNFYHYNTNNSALPDDKINCLKFSPFNDLWLGTESQGLVKIEIPTTSLDKEKTSCIQIWPSIFYDTINTQLEKASKIYILNMQGQIIDNYNFKAGYHNIHTNKYKSGIYVIIVESDNDRTIKKLIKP